jgi:hypothetical protein
MSNVLTALHKLRESVYAARHRVAISPSESANIQFESGDGIAFIRSDAIIDARDACVEIPPRRVGHGGQVTFRLVPNSLMKYVDLDLVASASVVLAHIGLDSDLREPLPYSVCVIPSSVAASGGIEIVAAIPAGVEDGVGAILSSVSIAGSAVELPEAPVRCVVGFKHAPATAGRVYCAARDGDTPSLVQALNDGDSTQEVDVVGSIVRCV